MLEVCLGLFLGGTAAVAEPDHLREVGVTAVLTVDSEEPNFKTGGWGRGSTESLRASAGQTRDRPAQSSGPLCGLHRPGSRRGPRGAGALVSGRVRGESDPPRFYPGPPHPFPPRAQKRTTGLSGR